MIRSVVFDNQIKLWWDFEPNRKEGYGFKVVKNAEEIITTDKYNVTFNNLTPETEYFFRLSLVSESGLSVKDLGEITVKTSAYKQPIDVTKPPYNAVADGVTLNTVALQKAIDDCAPNQKVYFPNGVYLTGALEIKSNTELYLEKDAVIQGTTDQTAYLPKVKDRFEGNACECYKSLINTGVMDEKGGYNAFNITIRGGSIIGGGNKLRENIINAEKLKILKEHGLENELNPPVFYSRTLPGRARGRLLRTFNTQNVILSDCKMGDGPAWNIHFIYSDNIITCGCEIFSYRISNGDGWDPDSSTNLVLFDTKFKTGDDCIAIKSGKNLEGYLIARPTKNVKIFNCESIDGHGLAIGSEMSGGIDGVEVWDCDFSSSNTGISIKTSSVRGGYIKNISFRNFKGPKINITQYKGNDDGDKAPVEPYLENFIFDNLELSGIMKLTGTNRVEKVSAIEIHGFSKQNPVKNVSISNVKLGYLGMSPNQVIDLYNTENVTIKNISCAGECAE